MKPHKWALLILAILAIWTLGPLEGPCMDSLRATPTPTVEVTE